MIPFFPSDLASIQQVFFSHILCCPPGRPQVGDQALSTQFFRVSKVKHRLIGLLVCCLLMSSKSSSSLSPPQSQHIIHRIKSLLFPPTYTQGVLQSGTDGVHVVLSAFKMFSLSALNSAGTMQSSPLTVAHLHEFPCSGHLIETDLQDLQFLCLAPVTWWIFSKSIRTVVHVRDLDFRLNNIPFHGHGTSFPPFVYPRALDLCLGLGCCERNAYRHVATCFSFFGAHSQERNH